jgi:hypothetical protein
MIKNRRRTMAEYAKKHQETKFDKAVKTGVTTFVNNVKGIPQAFKTVGSQIKNSLTKTPIRKKRR